MKVKWFSLALACLASVGLACLGELLGAPFVVSHVIVPLLVGVMWQSLFPMVEY